MWKPVPLPDGSYKDDTRPFSHQDLQNYLPVFAEAEGTRSPMKLVAVPGMPEYASVGTGPVRALHDAEGKFIVVSGEKAYWLKSPSEVEEIGDIPGRAQVWIVHNQITNGNEVLFSTGPEAWIWNTVTGLFTRISDDAFMGAISPVYLKSYFIGIETQRRFFSNSALASGLEWDSIERYEAESLPDRLQCLVASHNELAAFGEDSVEFFDVTTNPEDIANHILLTNKGIVQDVGGASRRCANVLDNSIFVVSSNGSAYRFEGYTPVRISSFAIEQAWSRCDLSKCFTFTFEDRGHKIWYITFPVGDDGPQTWGYDCASRKWHRRESKNIGRWRANCLFKWRGDTYAGSYNSGVIYRLDWDYALEGCDELASSFTTGVLHDEGNRISVDGIRIEFDSGSTKSVCVDVEPAVPPDEEPPPPDADLPGFYAVTDNAGQLLQSDHGVTWTDLAPATLSGVVGRCISGAGTAPAENLVISDFSGNIYYSTDSGATFTAATDGPFAGIQRFVHNGTRILGFRNSGIIYSTDGGDHWTVGGNFGSAFFNQACFGVGQFVIATSNGLWSTTDGITVVKRSTGDWTGVGFNGEGFLAGINTGSFFKYSTGGTTWAVTGGSVPSATPRGITGAAGYFVVGSNSDGVFRTTDNGVTFSSIFTTTSSLYVSAVSGDDVVFGSGGAGGTKQFVSADEGLSFTELSPLIADNDICVPLQ